MPPPPDVISPNALFSWTDFAELFSVLSAAAYLFVKQYSTTRLAAIRGQSDRNIRKLRMTIQKKLQKRMYEHLSEKLENDQGLTLRECEFMEKYEASLQTMGKDAVIRRENKTKPRKKKAALDETKDG